MLSAVSKKKTDLVSRGLTLTDPRSMFELTRC